MTSFPDHVTLTGEDVARLFDLTIHSPLICSGEFENDDVDLLRKVATALGGIDLDEITPAEFIANYPHRFVPVKLKTEYVWVEDGTGALRKETEPERLARVALGAPDACGAGTWRRECGRPAADERHVQ